MGPVEIPNVFFSKAIHSPLPALAAGKLSALGLCCKETVKESNWIGVHRYYFLFTVHASPRRYAPPGLLIDPWFTPMPPGKVTLKIPVYVKHILKLLPNKLLQENAIWMTWNDKQISWLLCKHGHINGSAGVHVWCEWVYIVYCPGSHAAWAILVMTSQCYTTVTCTASVYARALKGVWHISEWIVEIRTGWAGVRAQGEAMGDGECCEWGAVDFERVVCWLTYS